MARRAPPPKLSLERGRDSRPRNAPGLWCECGVYGDHSLTALLAYGVIASLAHEARDANSAEKLAFAHTVDSSSNAPAFRLARSAWDSGNGDVPGWRDWCHVGEVERTGHCLPPRKDDTRTTPRAERARVGQRIFTARPMWRHAEPSVRVHPWSTAVRVETLLDVSTRP